MTFTHPAPVPGVYPFSDAGEAIEICRAEGTVDGTSIGPVRVFMPMRRDAHVRWSAVDLGAMSLFEVSALSMEHPDLGPVDVPITGLGNDWGTVQPVEVGAGSELARAIVHWVNLPQILPGAPLSEDGSIWRSRWELETCGWKLTIDSRRDLGQAIRSAAGEYGELLLLRRLGYRGGFCRRYPPGRWVGSSEPVPWAAADS